MRAGDWIIIVLVALITVADVALVAVSRQTISRRLRWLGRRVAFVPYSWGVLAGHFWGPGSNPYHESWIFSILLLLAGGAIVTVSDIAIRRVADPGWWLVLIYCLCGVPSGIFFWPQ